MRATLQLAVLLSLAPFVHGCSYLFMEPPPPAHARLNYFQCRTSRGTPTLDVVYGLSQVAGGLLMVASGQDHSGSRGDELTAYGLTSVVIGATALASSAYGFSAASECEAAYQALAERQVAEQQRIEARDMILVHAAKAQLGHESAPPPPPAPPQPAPVVPSAPSAASVSPPAP